MFPVCRGSNIAGNVSYIEESCTSAIFHLEIQTTSRVGNDQTLINLLANPATQSGESASGDMEKVESEPVPG